MGQISSHAVREESKTYAGGGGSRGGRSLFTSFEGGGRGLKFFAGFRGGYLFLQKFFEFSKGGLRFFMTFEGGLRFVRAKIRNPPHPSICFSRVPNFARIWAR